MKNTVITVVSVVLLSTTFLTGALAQSKPELQIFDVSSGGTLTLDSDAGSVHISSHDKATVEVMVENRSGDKALVVRFKQFGNDVSVVGEREKRWGWGWGSNIDIRFTIKVPAEYNIDVKTGGGSIGLADLSGEVKARTSGGSITLGKIRGNVDAKTSGGSIRVDEVAGNIDAHTNGGSIKVTITEQPTSDSRLTTSGGSVTAHLASDIAVDLVASTSGGGVWSDFKVNGYTTKRSIEGKLNGGGPQLLLRTSGGSVSVKEI